MDAKRLAEIKARLDGVFRGPFRAEDSEDSWDLYIQRTPEAHGLKVLKAHKHGCPYAEYWPNPAEADFIVNSPADIDALIEALEAAWAENERLRGAVDSAGADIDWLRKRISGFKLLLSEHHNPTGIMRLIALDPGDNCPICRDHWPQEAPNSSG